MIGEKDTKDNRIRKGYNRLSPVYDILAGIFFFDRINKSQTALSPSIPDFDSCLIVGGGSGHFLATLLQTKQSGTIVYVDVSDKMIQKAQQRIANLLPLELHRVEFRCMDVRDDVSGLFDLIVCNYFLDLFTDTEASALIGSYYDRLKTDGILYVTDFAYPDSNQLLQWVAKGLLSILYLLFRLTTSMKTKRLPDLPVLLKKGGFECVKARSFWKGIMHSGLYKKRHPFIS